MAVKSYIKEFCAALEAEGIQAERVGMTGHSRMILDLRRGSHAARLVISTRVSKGTHAFKNNLSKARRLINADA